MNTIKAILIIVILIFFSLSTQAIGETNSIFKIPFKSGTILLEKGVCDTGHLKTVEAVPKENKYVIVKFAKALKRTNIKELEKRGIKPLSPLRKNAWICSVSPMTLSEKEMDKYAIAAMAPWKEEYKILPELKNEHFQEWAVMENGNIKLLVSSFGDVDKKDMESLLAKYSSSYEIFSAPSIWAIQIAPDNIENLINESAIHFVEEGPKPDEHRLMFCIGMSLLSIKYNM